MMVKRSLRTFEIMTWVLVELFTFCFWLIGYPFYYVSCFLIICFIFFAATLVDWNAEDLYRFVFNRNSQLVVTELPKEVQALAPDA